MRKQDEIVKFVNLPFSEGIEAVTGVNISNFFKRHIHKAYIIGTVTEGKRVILHPGGSSEISNGEIFIINPGQVHSCGSAQENIFHSYQVLTVSPDKMQSIAKQISEKPENKPYFKLIKYNNLELSDLFSVIFKLLETTTFQLEIEGKINSFLSKIVLELSEFPPVIYQTGDQNLSVKRVCDYIANHYSENLSLNRLSKIACLSPYHFQKVFTKIMGISAHDYLTYHRIGEAKKMLLFSKEIADIAIKTGFADQSHFSRVFKKTVGIPPGKFININKTPLTSC